MSDPCTCAECNAKQNRIHAFGAIRRAVLTARHFDAKARNARKTLAHRTPDTDTGIAIATIDTAELIADSVRYSIRTAIGSVEPS